MRIALALYGSLDTLSGGYRYDRRLVHYLREAGDAVEVISLPDQGYPLNRFDDLRAESIKPIENIPYDLLLIDELVHPSLALSVRILKKRRPEPIVGIVHHLRSDEPRNIFLRPWYRRIERRFIHGLDGYICNSEVTRERVHRLARPDIRSVVVPPSVVLEEKPPTPEEIEHLIDEAEGPVNILLVGNVIRRKGVLTLLHALERLHRMDWRLTIVGRTDLEPRYVSKVRRRIEAMPLRGRVEIVGAIESDRLAHLYRTADIFAMPSTYEGFGISYLEAMAHGLPVIASAAGGARAIVRENGNGFLVEPGNVAMIADRLGLLITDKVLRRNMGVTARAAYDLHPKWNDSLAKAHDFLHTFPGVGESS